MRRDLIVANWKMNTLLADTREFARKLLSLCGTEADGGNEPEVVIAPPFPALPILAAALSESFIGLAAQDVSVHPMGAFTGEIAAAMLADLGCRYCIVGHSERRSLFGEPSEAVSGKAKSLLEAGITPIVCVGESREERENGRTEDVVLNMLRSSIPPAGTPGRGQLVVAYEPVWAIGTGLTATPDQAQEVHALIRKCLQEELGGEAQAIRIQYGGSVNPNNVRALMEKTDIDGALVGGASLDPTNFSKIIDYTSQEGISS